MEMHFQNTAVNFINQNKNFLPFHPFATASRRDAYDKLPADLKADIIALGETYLHKDYPTIRATDFMAFKRTGNRVDYEDIYFGRRYALNSLVVAECVEQEGRFLDDIINGIFLLCEESAWQLPAHNSYPGSPSQQILPDSTVPVLDLFACETGALLACILYFLEEQLDAISPFISKRIRHELDRRIITPYINEHFWWMGQEDKEMCNWTPWCTQNVLYTVFLDKSDHNKHCYEQVFRKAAASCDYFLKDYGEDGCCDEGAQYYRHAGLCLDGAARVLDAITGGAFAELMHSPKIKNIAAYIYNVHVDDKYYFNFADCSPIAGRAGVREYLFGKDTCQPALMHFAAKDFAAANGDIFSDESNRLNLFYRMQTVFHYQEVLSYGSNTSFPENVDSCTDIFYPSVGLFISRNRTFSLAVKAGDNADSHNHNDTGSITLYKDGKPIFVDIGVESYTQKTFSAKRYEIWTMQSGYHNLPTINGMDQHDGISYCAENVITEFTEQTSRIFMDLANAYPFEDKKPVYERCVTFDKSGNRIILTDATDSTDVILNFITYELPAMGADTITIGNAIVSYSGVEPMTVETLPITDKRLQTAWDHDLYRIRLRMTGDTFTMNIR